MSAKDLIREHQRLEATVADLRRQLREDWDRLDLVAIRRLDRNLSEALGRLSAIERTKTWITRRARTV